MIITDVRNPKYSNLEKTRIDCEIELDNSGEYMSFTADLNDIEAHSVEVFNKADNEDYGTVGLYVPPITPPVIEPSKEQLTRSEYPDEITMMEAAFKQFKAMEVAGTVLEPETKTVLDTIVAAEDKYK